MIPQTLSAFIIMPGDMALVLSPGRLEQVSVHCAIKIKNQLICRKRRKGPRVRLWVEIWIILHLEFTKSPEEDNGLCANVEKILVLVLFY